MSVAEYVGLSILAITLALLGPLLVYTCAKLWAYGRLKGERLFHKHYPDKEECRNGDEQKRPRKV